MRVTFSLQRSIALVGCLGLGVGLAHAQEAQRYRILEGSHAFQGQDPVVVMPMHGTFDLKPSPDADQFQVESFRGFDPYGVQHVTGEGLYWIDGAEHRLFMIVELSTGAIHTVDSGWVPFGIGQPPMFDILAVDESSPGPAFGLRILGVPALGVWFSTETEFHDENGELVSHGDVLSHGGAVLWTNAELTENLFLMGPSPDVGLDALCPAEIDEVPWWQPWFSMESDAYSETLGPLQHGDFLSQGGFIAERNQDLVANFWPVLEADFGLDAITFGWWCGNWYFSVEESFWSDHMMRWILPGDLLCRFDGWIVFPNSELMANFNPLDPVPEDFGLDAVYMWPTGQFWFSIDQDFYDANYGLVQDGDLLSMEGWIIYRNLQLVHRFGPLEDLDDFGLDALHVVSIQRGDMNGDGLIDFDDINPFVLALSNPTAYYGEFSELDRNVVGDINYDGAMDLRDINYFVLLLTSQP